MAKRTMGSFLKIFAGCLCGFYLLFLWLVSRCTFQITDTSTQTLLGTAKCFGYVILAIGSFIFGLLPTLLGMQEARAEGKSTAFFNIILLIFLAGIALTIFMLIRR